MAAFPVRRLRPLVEEFEPHGRDLPVGALINSGMDIDKAMALPNTRNLHINLERILEKFKLDTDHIESAKDLYNQNKVSDINSQLKLIKLSIKNSDKIVFNLYSFEKKYPLVYYLIQNKLSKKEDNLGEQQKNLIINDEIDYNDILRGLNPSTAGNLQLSTIINFRSATNIQSRSDDTNREVLTNFEKQLRERNLYVPGSEDEKKIEICSTIGSKKSCLLSKKALLEIIENLESIYTQIAEASKWKQYTEYLKNITETSFEQYCSASQKYKYIEQLQKQIKLWISEYDKLTTNIKEENQSNLHLSNQKKFDSILAQKYDHDQQFLTEILLLLNIDEYKNEMENAAKIFTLHHQLVNDFIQPFAKSNICRICLFDEANQFISPCGHVICEKCAKSLSNNNMDLYRFDDHLGTKQMRCPYCSKDFQSNELKKIFY